MCSCDVAAPGVWDAVRPKARRQYCCEECTHDIKPGETYVRVGALHDGYWSTFRFCLFCEAFAREAQRAGVCYEVGSLYNCTLSWALTETYERAPGGSCVEFVRVPALFQPGDQDLLNGLAGRKVFEP